MRNPPLSDGAADDNEIQSCKRSALKTQPAAIVALTADLIC